MKAEPIDLPKHNFLTFKTRLIFTFSLADITFIEQAQQSTEFSKETLKTATSWLLPRHLLEETFCLKVTRPEDNQNINYEFYFEQTSYIKPTSYYDVVLAVDAYVATKFVNRFIDHNINIEPNFDYRTGEPTNALYLEPRKLRDVLPKDFMSAEIELDFIRLDKGVYTIFGMTTPLRDLNSQIIKKRAE